MFLSQRLKLFSKTDWASINTVPSLQWWEYKNRGRNRWSLLCSSIGRSVRFSTSLVVYIVLINNLDMLRANGIAPMASTSSATHHNKPQSDIKPAVKREATEIPEHDTAKEILSLEVSTLLQTMNLTDSYSWHLPRLAPSGYSEEATVQH